MDDALGNAEPPKRRLKKITKPERRKIQQDTMTSSESEKHPELMNTTQGSNYIFLVTYNLMAASSSVSSSSLLEGKLAAEASGDSSLEKAGTQIFHHSEVHLCPRASFKLAEQKYLDDIMPKSTYLKVDKAWWKTKRHVLCGVITYGSGASGRSCSGVSLAYPFLAQSHRGPYKDSNGKYLYGTTNLNIIEIKQSMCRDRCGDSWSAQAYGFVNHNCNTFSKSVLKCVLGVSERQPLGWSSMGRADCCDAGR